MVRLVLGEPGPRAARQGGGTIAMHSFNWAFTRLSRSACLAGLSALVACGLLLVMVRPAAAQLNQRSHDHIVVTIPHEKVSGVRVTTTIALIAHEQERLSNNGFPLFKHTAPGPRAP